MPTAARTTSPVLSCPVTPVQGYSGFLLLWVQYVFIHGTCGSVQAGVIAFSGACVSSSLHLRSETRLGNGTGTLVGLAKLRCMDSCSLASGEKASSSPSSSRELGA